MKHSASLIKKLIYFFTLLFFVLLNIIFALVGKEGSRIGGIILMLPVGVVFILMLAHKSVRIDMRPNSFNCYMLLLSVFCFVSSIWAERQSVAINRGIEIFELFIVMAVFHACYKDDDSFDALFELIMYGGFLVVSFYVMRYGWSYAVVSLRNAERVSSDLINANSLGMAAAYSLVIAFNYLVIKRAKIWWVPFIALSVIILFASQSRKAVLILFLGCFGSYVCNNLKNKRAISNAIKLLLFFLIIVVALYAVSKLKNARGVLLRMQSLIRGLFDNNQADKSTLIRVRLKEIGKELFMTHPMLGVGIDCARYYVLKEFGTAYYLHDNFIEMLADGGIVGFIAYYWIYFVMLFRAVKYRDFDDPEYVIFLIMLLLRLLMEYGAVSFVDKDTYIYLMVLWLESQRIKNERSRSGLIRILSVG